MPEYKKREIAYKLRIGEILQGTPIVEDIPQEAAPNPNETASQVTKERFRFLELGEKRIVRVNIVANVVDKYNSAGDKQYATITVDDATGQIRVKAFGDSINLIQELSHGDTVILIGVLRAYAGEVYVSPEIVRKADPRYLLVRKLELDDKQGAKIQKPSEPQKELETKDKIIEIIKTAGDSSGVSTEEIILKLNTLAPEVINSEIIHLIEDGMIYEPRPGRVRWLG